MRRSEYYWAVDLIELKKYQNLFDLEKCNVHVYYDEKHKLYGLWSNSRDIGFRDKIKSLADLEAYASTRPELFRQDARVCEFGNQTVVEFDQQFRQHIMNHYHQTGFRLCSGYPPEKI